MKALKDLILKHKTEAAVSGFLPLASRGRSVYKRGTEVNRFFVLYLTRDVHNFVKFLQDGKLLRSSVDCDKCGGRMRLKASSKCSDKLLWQCGRTLDPGVRCYGETSVRHGSWFSGTKLSMEEVFWLVYEILSGSSPVTVAREYQLTTETVDYWTRIVRALMTDDVKKSNRKIGGVGRSVEVIESSLSMVGGVDGVTGDSFLVGFGGPQSDSLIWTLGEWVLPGTTVVTACTRSYPTIDDARKFEKFSIDHAVQFVDPTSEQESASGPLCLGETLFRRKAEIEGEDIFVKFIHLLSRTEWDTIPS